MLTLTPHHRALGQLARRRGRPDTSNRSGASMGGVSGRTADLTQVRSILLTCRRMPHNKHQGHDGKVRRHADLRGRTRGIHPSGRAPIPSRDDRRRVSAQGPKPTVLTQRIWRQSESTR
ncbi:hypothetical protein BHM03_00025441 [Ensete ventricosum]|nr:hypothetical protein BHM03_00025441 [Ensete ventricosum]